MEGNLTFGFSLVLDSVNKLQIIHNSHVLNEFLNKPFHFGNGKVFPTSILRYFKVLTVGEPGWLSR